MSPKRRILSLFIELRRSIDRPWYPLALGGLAFADFYVGVIPIDPLLVSSVVLRPRWWLRLALATTAGSTLGSVAIAATVREFGLPFLESLLGEGLLTQPSWVWFGLLLERYGVLGIFLMAIGPLPLVPISALSGLSSLSYSSIGLASLLGRLMKYLVFSWVAARAPHLLKRLRWFDPRPHEPPRL